MLTSTQLTALKTELQTDPNAYGYAPLLAQNNHSALADELNKVRASISLPRPDVTPMEILEAIDIGEFVVSQTVLMGSWFESLTQFPSVRILKENGEDTRVMTNIMKVLKNSQPSESRVRALAVRKGSRAEQLFGAGIVVTLQDVQQALVS